jgi:hypothetical protein
LCVLIVFEHEQQGQPPFRCNVERLVDNALTQGPITNARRDDPTVPGQFRGEGQSCRDGHDATLNAVTEKAFAMQVLAATETAADACPLTHDFGDQSLDVVGPGKVVTMTPVVGVDDVALSIKALGKHDGGHLLANAGMRRSVKLSGRKQAQQFLLHKAHLACLIDSR